MAPTPLTVLSPVPRWWGAWARLTWLVARLARGLVQKPLRDLSFIHFAHWSLVDRWPPDPAVSPDDAADRTLVFLTTFDGSDIQYIDAFVRVVPFQIEALYGGAREFPGPFPFRDAARAAIAEHWSAGRSPFALVPGTHLGRLQVLRAPARRGRRGTREHVLLAADADAPMRPWLERFRAAAAPQLDAVLG